MPEMPDVVATEPVESAWGNDIRDRTVQRYADSDSRDALVPLPIAGDTAWLDDEQHLTVFDGTVWVSMVRADGDTMTGALIIKDIDAGAVTIDNAAGQGWGEVRYINHTLPDYWRIALTDSGNLRVQRSPDGVGSWVTQVIFSPDSAEFPVPVLMPNESRVQAIAGGTLRFDLQRGDNWWRFAIGGGGDLLLQSSPDGTTFTTVDTWVQA